MPSETIIAASNICQAAVPLISLLAYVPQWAKLLRTKSSASISMRSWCAWTVSGSFALFYAVTQLLLNGRGWALVLSSSLGLAFVLCTLFLVVRFRHGSIHCGKDAGQIVKQRQNRDSEANE
ncbi:MAG: PQ-loop repeat-containing protein [Lentisphaerae bacterium]|nr:PQ-loop repeat-containing protein [Lentisphaerota bacterium]